MDENDDRGWHVAILVIGLNFRGIDVFATEIRKRAGVRKPITSGLHWDIPMLFFRKLKRVPERLDRGLAAVLRALGPLFEEGPDHGRTIVIPTRDEAVRLLDVGLWHYLTAALKGGGKAGIELAEQWAIAMQTCVASGESVSVCAQTTLDQCCQTLFEADGPTGESLGWAIGALKKTWVYGAELSTVEVRCGQPHPV